MAARKPYGAWLNKQLVKLVDQPTPKNYPGHDFNTIRERQRAFGYTIEDLRLLMTVGYRVANAAKYPEWKPGTEFKARREEMLRRTGN